MNKINLEKLLIGSHVLYFLNLLAMAILAYVGRWTYARGIDLEFIKANPFTDLFWTKANALLITVILNVPLHVLTISLTALYIFKHLDRVKRFFAMVSVTITMFYVYFDEWLEPISYIVIPAIIGTYLYKNYKKFTKRENYYCGSFN